MDFSYRHLTFAGAAIPVCASFLTDMGITMPSLKTLRPKLTKYTGGLIFLTRQCNWLLCGFFTYNLLQPASPLIPILSPGIFALGCFVTLAYYSLDFANKKKIQLRAKLREQGYYPAFAAHAEHILALPTVCLHLLTSSFSPIPSLTLSLGLVGSYLAFYCASVHFNQWMTGELPYPIMDEAEKRGFLPGLELGLSGFFIGLGYVGHRLMRLDFTNN